MYIPNKDPRLSLLFFIVIFVIELYLVLSAFTSNLIAKYTKIFELLTKSDIKRLEELQNVLISNVKQSTMVYS